MTCGGVQDGKVLPTPDSTTMIIYRCPKDGKTADRSQRCPACDTWMLQDSIPDSRLREAHERSHDEMAKTHGKAMADRQWKPLK